MSPGLSRNATSSNSFTITPRRNHPSSPPCSRDTLSPEYFLAISGKLPPWRSTTSSDSASCRARARAAESGLGTITIWRNEMGSACLRAGRAGGELPPVRLGHHQLLFDLRREDGL